MKSVKVRDAKAGLSALIEAAEHGEPTTITRHGRPAAVIVPVAEARKLYDTDRPNLGLYLLSFPGEVEFERNPTAMREVDL